MPIKSKTTPALPAVAAPVNSNFKLYLAAFIAALGIFGFMTYLAAEGSPLGWEVTMLTAINGWSEGWYRFLTVVTFFGSTWGALLAVVSTFALRMYNLAWRLALTIIGAYGVAFLAKHFIGRERPAEILTNIHARIAETGMGFPSGHATVSTVIAFTLWPYLPRLWRYLMVPVFVGLICLSRLYLGVHFPLDVIGGIALGIAAVSFIRILPAALRRVLRIS